MFGISRTDPAQLASSRDAKAGTARLAAAAALAQVEIDSDGLDLRVAGKGVV
jgi:hypothetical protein